MRLAARLWWLFPVAVAVQPPLYLFAANRYGLEAVAPVVLSAVVALGACLLMLAVLTAVFRDKLVASVVTALATILLYGYIPLYATSFGVVAGLAGDAAARVVVRHRYLLPAFVLVVAWLMRAAVRRRRALPDVVPILTVVGVVLLVQPAIRLVAGAPEAPRAAEAPLFDDLPPPPAPPPVRPDIYYIVLDAYGSQRALSSTYGFDNAAFVSGLRARGFYVADDSRANYPQTRFSLPSSLNVGYLESAGRLSYERTDELVDDNRVERFLKSLGYRIVRFPTWLRMTRLASHADRRLGPIEGPGPSPFAQFVLARSLFKYALDRTWVREAREHTLQVFDLLPPLAREEGPTFAFVHILCPHEPFVFDAGGGPVPFGEREWDPTDPASNARYVDQVRFVNRRVDRLLSRMLSEDRRPIVVIQGDHGPLVSENGARRYESGILNALLLPDGGADALYSSITPVNTFRVILDRYFGTRLGRLPDRWYRIEETPTSLEFLPAGGDGPGRP